MFDARQTINPLTYLSALALTTTDSGRLTTFTTPQSLTILISRTTTTTTNNGHPNGFPIAIPQVAHRDALLVTFVGVWPVQAVVLSRKPPNHPTEYLR